MSKEKYYRMILRDGFVSYMIDTGAREPTTRYLIWDDGAFMPCPDLRDEIIRKSSSQGYKFFGSHDPGTIEEVSLLEFTKFMIDHYTMIREELERDSNKD